MERSALTLIIILCFIFKVNGQEENVWYDAKVKFLDGREIVGTANYNTRYGVIQVKVGDKVETFLENKIQSMLLKKGQLEHDFRLVAIKSQHTGVKVILAELLYQSNNHYSLFIRHKAITEGTSYNVSPMVPMGVGPPTLTGYDIPIQTKVKYKPNLNSDSFVSVEDPMQKRSSRKTSFFLMIDYEGNIVPLTKGTFYEIHSDKKDELKKYIKSNLLSFRKKADLIKMIAYYDEISH
ncbi:hypothetical protein EV198_2966 [Roseivirga ehrenbergii]|uniref:Uncharacterized protein n=1 Tax=Roseivirga ehrenbergii (strain DSM 102268 / JCM 13514 / KCTC 12282 / NCIMB 14502 / KMM 6017) TaxID=279360 RepID=A0A150XQS0_ROSEK|nr:hypothetical protein [Roseivirga ehrenbergii]KYG81076.1 hypothetical protein MB14_14975 [Roseivirga ehrenbergii]TCL00949.1 hypothetical protein EV198_2966 [Roseivirga ehrenbergii]